jgi:hypothetical protein
VLSDHEQRVWHEIERSYADRAGELDGAGRPAARPRTRSSRGSDGVFAVAVGGVCIALMFVLVGAPVVGLAVGGITGLGWLLWRFWPHIGQACATAWLPMAGGVEEASGPDDASPGRPRRTPEAG